MKFFASLLFLSALSLVTACAEEPLATQVFAELNLARTAPAHYARIVAGQTTGDRHEDAGAIREAIRFLKSASPLPPLIFSEGISRGALSHVLQTGPAGARGHRGVDGSMPWDRIARFGQWAGASGENISYGKMDARSIVVSLIVDAGVAGRGHRKNIFSRDYHFTGVATGHHARYASICVMDFAGFYDERPAARVARTASEMGPQL